MRTAPASASDAPGRLRSLRGSLFALVAAVALALVAAGAVLVMQLAREQRSAAQRGLIDTARALSTAIDGEIGRGITALLTLGLSRNLDERDFARFESQARALKAQYPGFDTISLMGRDGQQLVNLYVTFGTPLPNIGNQPIVQATLRSERANVSDLFVGAVANQPVVGIVTPVTRGGRVAYLLGANLSLARLSEILAAQGLAEPWFVVLIDREMKVIARSVDHAQMVGQPAPAWLKAAIAGRGEGVAHGPTLAGSTDAFGFYRSRLTGWTISIVAPAEDITGPVWRTILMGSGVIAIVLALALFATVRLARRVARPIAALAGAAEAFSTRRAIVDVAPSPIAEFERLRAVLVEAGRAALTAAQRDRAKIAAGEARFRAAQEAALDGFMIYRPVRDIEGGIRDFEIVYANPAAVSLKRLPKGEVIGRRIGDILPAALAPGGLVERQAKALATGRSQQFVLELELDGAKRFFQNVVITFEGLVAANFRDVTDRLRQHDDLLEARRRAEQANAAKTRFLAAASHDLRQPYQAMRLFHRLLAEAITDPAQKRWADALGTALGEGEDLLNALLDVATLESGQLKPKISAFRAAPILESLAVQYGPVAKESGLAFKVRHSALAVESDAILLRRMLANLLANAMRYTKRGGIVFACRRRGEQAVFEVWDTGPGIPAEARALIWEDFYQLGNPERDRAKGLGLGLSIVRRTAALLGHEVSASSRLGRGSVFRIAAPLATAAAAAAPAAGAVAAHAAARDVLVVEDDPIQRMGMADLLGSWGHRVRAACDGAEAMALVAAERPPALIVSDLRLPGQASGTALIAALRQATHADIPAVIITGDTSIEELDVARAAGCTVLRKPFEPERLREAVDALTAA